MGDLTKNFSRREFECKCGCGADTVDFKLIELMQNLRDRYGAITVNSGIRCKEHNFKIGGVSTSQHLTGKACDFTIDDKTRLKEIADYLDSYLDSTGGIGLYKSFVHVDVRAKMARWART